MKKLNFIDYDVLIVDNLDSKEFRKEFAKITPLRKVFVVTDENVNNLYRNVIDRIYPGAAEVIVLKTGDQCKSFESYQNLIKILMDLEMTREDLLVAFGGGAISDLVGFVAATYKRGLRYINIPTTIIGQIDASIGGKVGVNFEGVKNQVGAFYDPLLVVIPLDFLETLPQEQIESGMGEVFKMSLIGSRKIYDLIGTPDFKITESVVAEILKVKMNIVEKDYFDRGERHVLNLGHTFSHAIESFTNFKVQHGVAVLMGIMGILRIGYKLGITKKEVLDEVTEKIKSLGYKDIKHYDYKDLRKYILKDKKAKVSGLDIVVISDIEQLAIINIPWEELDEVLS